MFRIGPRSSVRPGSSLNPWAIFPAHKLFLSKCEIYRTVLLTLVTMGYARSWIYLFILLENFSSPHPSFCNLLPCSVFLHSTCITPQISGNSLICLGDAVSSCKIWYKNESPCSWKYSQNHVWILRGARFIRHVGGFIKRLVKRMLSVYHLASCRIPESSVINIPSLQVWVCMQAFKSTQILLWNNQNVMKQSLKYRDIYKLLAI